VGRDESLEKSPHPGPLRSTGVPGEGARGRGSGGASPSRPRQWHPGLLAPPLANDFPPCENPGSGTSELIRTIHPFIMEETVEPIDLTSLSVDAQLSHEWLSVNHLGGYAASTLPGCNTRKYHGLLVAAMSRPVRRMVLLSRAE